MAGLSLPAMKKHLATRQEVFAVTGHPSGAFIY